MTSKAKSKAKSNSGQDKPMTPPVPLSVTASETQSSEMSVDTDVATEDTISEDTATHTMSTLSLNTTTKTDILQPPPKLVDPMKLFPIELAVKIFSNLNIPDIIQCRGVCRAWRDNIVDSTEVKFMMVQRWETHDPADSARQPCSVDATEADRAKDIQERYAILENQFSGRPVSHHLLKRPSPPIRNHVSWSMKGRYLAHLGPAYHNRESSRYILLHDLITGSARKITPGGKTLVASVLVTEDLLAYWGERKLWVMPLHGSNTETRVIDLPLLTSSGAGSGCKQFVGGYGRDVKEGDLKQSNGNGKIFEPRVWIYDYEQNCCKVLDQVIIKKGKPTHRKYWTNGLIIDQDAATQEIFCTHLCMTLDESPSSFQADKLNKFQLSVQRLKTDGTSLSFTTLKYKSKVRAYAAPARSEIDVIVRPTGSQHMYALRVLFPHHSSINDIVIDLQGTPTINSTLQHPDSSALWKNVWYQWDAQLSYVIQNSRRSLQGGDIWKRCSTILRCKDNMHGKPLDLYINDSFLVIMIEYHKEMYMHVLYFDQSHAHSSAMPGRFGVVPRIEDVPEVDRHYKREESDHAFTWRPGTFEVMSPNPPLQDQLWADATFGPDAVAWCNDCYWDVKIEENYKFCEPFDVDGHNAYMRALGGRPA